MQGRGQRCAATPWFVHAYLPAMCPVNEQSNDTACAPVAQANGSAAASATAPRQHAPVTGPRIPPGWLETPAMAGSWGKLIPVKVRAVVIFRVVCSDAASFPARLSGNQMQPARLPIQVPLGARYNDVIPEHKRFTPQMLVTKLQSEGKQVRPAACHAMPVPLVAVQALQLFGAHIPFTAPMLTNAPGRPRHRPDQVLAVLQRGGMARRRAPQGVKSRRMDCESCSCHALYSTRLGVRSERLSMLGRCRCRGVAPCRSLSW